MTFSGANSFLNRGCAKNWRFLTKARIFSTAASLGRLNGRIMSGTAPFGICWFIDSTLRHQWHRACVEWPVSMTTSAPHAPHLNVRTSSVDSICDAPEPSTRPCSSPIGPSRPHSSRAFVACHSNRQKWQRRLPDAVLRLTSVAPQRGHFVRPSVAPTSVRTTRGPSPWSSGGGGGGGSVPGGAVVPAASVAIGGAGGGGGGGGGGSGTAPAAAGWGGGGGGIEPGPGGGGTVLTTSEPE